MKYDAFGRMTAYMVTGDTEDQPTRKIEYNDAEVPNSRKIVYRIKDGASATSITYFDGKGEQLQQRVQRTQLISWSPAGQTKIRRDR